MSSKSHGAGQLPIELTSFVGRRHELAEIKAALQVARLVTLTGIGGVGKTRLALRVGATVQRAFSDSVWLVELGELTDPSMLAETVVASLGVLDRTNRPARQLLEEHLAPRQLLLILDNCEHLLDAAAELAESVLKASPELRILATSREPLNIDGESVIRVPPLAVPDPASGSTGGLATGDAVALFAERARSHVPGFELTPQNRDEVIQICQRVDGLPLPIELAAARLRTLSTSQILEHLTDRYRLLTAGRRGAPSRQQTLRSSVDWSRDLCSPDEQRLWARLSVFAGGAELDAIEGICTDESTTADILDLVGSLVDKSIVIRDEPSARVRYRMLDTLREYGRADLLSSGEYADMRRRHRDWYRLMAQRAADEWVTASHSTWTTRLAREQPNLREALEYCFDEGDCETGLHIATALYPYWLNCGRFSEGRRWLDRALDTSDASSTVRARAILLDSVLAGLQDDTRSAGLLLEKASAITDQSASTTALAQYASGFLALYRGESDRAVSLFTSAATMFRTMADTYFEFGTLEGLGLAHLLAGHIDQAVDSLNDALAITAVGDLPELQAYPLWTLGIALWQQGNSREATNTLNRAIELSRRTDPLATAWCLQIMAWIAADNNLEQRAATLLGAAEALWHQLGGTTLTFPDMRVFQDHFEHQVRNSLGSKHFATARERGAAMSREEAVAFALDERADRTDAPTSELAKLTKREREVAALVAQGLTNKAIAEALVVSQRTAQGHVENILMKLGFTSRTQIAAWVVEQQ